MEENLQLRKYREYLSSGGKKPYDEWMNTGSLPSLWMELKLARNLPQNQTPEIQNALGPREHQAYAYDVMREHPLMGIPMNLIGVPGYSIAKSLGLVRGRSKVSLDELASGYQGMWQGMTANMENPR